MKMFFIFLPAAVLAITFSSSEGVVRRQIWPVPGSPNLFWNGRRNDRDFFDGGDLWPGPRRFDRPARFEKPSRNQNDFRDDFDFGDVRGNNRRNQNDFRDDFDFGDVGGNNNRRNQNDFRDDFDLGDNGNTGGNDRRNQNRRTTTENLGPITSTPRTIHVAPQGCQCPMTQQFNPVCGTDGNTYRNKGLLNCYSRCGSNVSEKRLGTC